MNHKVIEILVYPRHPLDEKTKPIKEFHTIAFDDTNLDEMVEKKLKQLYSWEKGFHYDYFEARPAADRVNKEQNTETLKTNTEMAKAKATTTTSVVLFEEQSKSLNLPAIPKVMTIGGLEFSEELIRKEVDDIKKISIEVPLDTDTKDILDKKKKAYEEMKTKKNQFVKTRTAPEKLRQEISKPINAWTKELKAQTDAYGSIATEGETHCVNEMKKYEDWEAEQANKEKLAAEKRLNDRSQLLSNLQGVKNFDSGHWTFPWGPQFVIEQNTLEAEFGWDDVYSGIKTAFDNYQVQKEKEDSQAAAVAEALVSSRVMLLEMMSYSAQDGNFFKNGHVITTAQIKSLPDADWKALLQAHNTPVTAPITSSPFTTAAPVTEQVHSPEPTAPVVNASPFGNPSPFAGASNNPFAQFETKQEPVVETPAQASSLLATEWPDDVNFVEYQLTSTVLRVYPEERSLAAQTLPVGKTVGFSGKLGLNLHFIIYK